MNVIRVRETASTNDLAAREPVGTAVIAETQTAGQGRFGRHWHSPRGGLYLSAHVEARQPAWLTAMSALAAGDAVRAVADREPRIRFPNDLMIHDRKVCGILIQARVPTAVIGIGLNVNIESFPPELEATSLQIETGRTFDLEAVAAELIAAIDRWLAADPHDVRVAYVKRDGVAGRRVVINDQIEGVVKAVDPIEGIVFDDGRRVAGAHVRHLVVKP